MAEKGKGGMKPRNSSRSGFSRARGGRGTYYGGVGRDPHAEGRGRGREEQRGRRSVIDGHRRSRGRRDAASRGFILDTRYEPNKLYVLGLNKITTKDGLKMFMERISECDVKHILWFKPKGKAIVTLNRRISDFPKSLLKTTSRIINDYKFDKIREEAQNRKLDYEFVLIERAPVCKSIFVKGIPEDTPQETIEKYFDKFGVVEKLVSNTTEVKANKAKEQRAILYFKKEKSVKNIVENDHFLADKVHLHVERYYPFMGTVEPVDDKGPRYAPDAEMLVSELPYFRMDVDMDIIEYVTSKCNQGLELKDRLSREHAHINLTNRDGYVLIKYGSRGQRPDGDFDEDEWERRCIEIITDFLERFAVRDIPVDKDIWEPVIDQLPQIEMMFPSFSAQVKKNEDLKGLRLICLKKDLPKFEEKVQRRLAEIAQAELDKTLEQKTLTDIPNEKLQLFKNAEIEHMLKKDVHQDVKAEIDLSKRSIFLKTPKDHILATTAYLRKRLEEIDQNSFSSPPEIIEILKTKVGKRKLNDALKDATTEGCAFNVNEKNNAVLFLGRTLSDTVKGLDLARKVLVTGKLDLKDSDNELLVSSKWDNLRRDLEKSLKIRCERRLTEFHVFGMQKDVEKALKKMRDILNEKKATEGEFRFDSPAYKRLFHDFHKHEITKLEEDLSKFSVKVTSNERGDLFFTGTAEGIKEIKDKFKAFQDEIIEKHFYISLPGMRSFLAKNKGELVGTVERENKCVIEIEEVCEEHLDEQVDSDDTSSLDTDNESEGFDEDDETFRTLEGKRIIYKRGKIEEEEADVLVCSVGSNLNLSIGTLARAMSKAAGPALKEALLKETSIMRPGGIVHTSSVGKLPCRHVVFCVCCPWDEGLGDEKEILQTLVRKCFDKALELGSCSIALPLIGTGNLRFPYEIAVQVMVDEALSHSKSYPDSPIEEVKFVVHKEDKSGLLAFEEKFRDIKKDPERERFMLPGNPLTRHLHCNKVEAPILTGPRCTRAYIGDTAVEIARGDITKESSEGIISVIGEDLQMKNGVLSAAIADASGSEVQEELTAFISQVSKTVLRTSAGHLPAKWIVHMVVQSGNKQHLQACVQSALQEVHSMELKSISIPAIGSGGLGLSPQESAEVVLGSIYSFLKTVGPPITVREIRVVLDDESVEEAFACTLQQMTSESSKSYSSPAQGDKEEEAIGTKRVIEGCRHKVVVYRRHEVCEDAIAALEAGVNKECQSVDFSEDAIHRLPKRCIKELRRKGREGDVSLDFFRPGTIVLKGFPSDVLKMHGEVFRVVQDQIKEEHQLERAEMTSRNVQWCYLSVSGKQEPFEMMANYEIETASQSKQPSVSFTHKQLKAEIIFDLHQVKFLKTGAVKAIFRKEVIPLPPDWDSHPLDQKGRGKRLHLVLLEEQSSEYQGVERMFMQSMTNEKVYLLSIQRVQNPPIYRSYTMKKQSMAEKNGNHKNERYLFHGTGYHNVKDICAHGFNRSFCGSNGVSYGEGVYFATEASYSLSFSKPPNSKGECCMFLAKVLSGKYATGKECMKTPPPIDPNKGDLLYDSVVNSTDDPTVFVVFQDDQCYPEYLITFKCLSSYY